jgi:ParB-like nuclease family protein
VEAIKASLRAHGQYRPIVVNRPTMQVLAGNHTLEAAKQLGWKEIAATFVDVDDEQARRIVLVDNRTNDLADYDPQALVDLLEELPDLEGSGYDQADLDALLDQVAWPAEELDGSTAALAAVVISDHSLPAALISGGFVALLVLFALMRFQRSAWKRGSTTPLIAGEEAV